MSKPAQTNDTTTAAEPQYARYTMLGFYNPEIAAIKRRTKQTFRDDITRLQFGDKGVNTDELHSIAVLYKKYIELKYQFKQMIIYDNFRKIRLNGSTADQQVLKIAFDKGTEHIFRDLRAEYYDIVTGKPLKSPINDMPNQNV